MPPAPPGTAAILKWLPGLFAGLALLLTVILIVEYAPAPDVSREQPGVATNGTSAHRAAPDGADPERAEPWRRVERVSAPSAMAVTANPHATHAAVAVLKAGGNAVDAAVTAQFVLNVVEPHSSGIGGGGFLLIRMAGKGGPVTVDGREEAPAGATDDQFLTRAGEPIPFFLNGIPCPPRMLRALYESFGMRHHSKDLSA